MTTNDYPPTHPDLLAAEVAKRTQDLVVKVEDAVTCPPIRDMGRTENRAYDAAVEAVDRLREAVEALSEELHACRDNPARRPVVPLMRSHSRL